MSPLTTRKRASSVVSLRQLTLAAALVIVFAAPAGAQEPSEGANAKRATPEKGVDTKSKEAPKPLKAPPPLEADAIRASIKRGVAFLVKNQKKHGGWGSPATNLWDIYSPAPGSQRSYMVASSALALSALLKYGGDSKDVRAAIDRGTAYLLKRYAVRRIRADTLYNTWALAYALEAFARLLDEDLEPERRIAVRKAAKGCVAMLRRFKFVEGGWGYYNFEEMTKDPGPGSVCFTTATVLIAMHMASKHKIRIDPKLVKGAMKVITLSKRPDNAFVYGLYLLYAQTMGINKVKGSLARTPPCLLAMELWGEDVPQKNMQKALDDLERHGHFLRIARKYPYPHESWYANSGYFCLYGYYYAAMCLPYLPVKERRAHAARIAKHMRKMQERDGSTWDYQLQNCHKYYGTGYAILTLGMCLDHGLGKASGSRGDEASDKAKAVAPGK